MYCSNCGEKAGDNKFCHKCGNQIKKVDNVEENSKDLASSGKNQTEGLVDEKFIDEGPKPLNGNEKKSKNKFYNFFRIIRYILFVVLIIVSGGFYIAYSDSDLTQVNYGYLLLGFSLLLLSINILPPSKNKIVTKSPSLFKFFGVPMLSITLFIIGIMMMPDEFLSPKVSSPVTTHDKYPSQWTEEHQRSWDITMKNNKILKEWEDKEKSREDWYDENPDDDNWKDVVDVLHDFYDNNND